MGSEPADVSQMCRDLLSTAVSEMGGQEPPAGGTPDAAQGQTPGV